MDEGDDDGKTSSWSVYFGACHDCAFSFSVVAFCLENGWIMTASGRIGSCFSCVDGEKKHKPKKSAKKLKGKGTKGDYLRRLFVSCLLSISLLFVFVWSGNKGRKSGKDEKEEAPLDVAVC